MAIPGREKKPDYPPDCPAALPRITIVRGKHGLLYVLAKKQAETVHVHKRPFTHIEHLFGLFFAQSRARIGAAVARGMALRAMGCSFLRHVALTRYGDQTLAAGEHLAPGFSQWRLALAA